MKFPQLKLANRGWAIAAFVYSAILLTIFVLAYTGKLPPQLSNIPFYDTLGHFILYGIATYLGHRVLKRRRINLLGYAIPLWPLLFAIFTVLEEGLQSFSPNRTFSWTDMIASMLGLLFGYWLSERR
ncbi:MAG: VanZ family protein [Xenococcaceae cyanobacterium]